MSIKRVPEGEDSFEQESLAASQRKARRAWKMVWQRILSITPSGLVRFLLVSGALVALLWLLISSLPSLFTLLIGLLLAYMTLPVVNWLDGFLPRWLAVLLVILCELAFVVLFLALLIPAAIQQILQFLRYLPSTEQLQALLTRLAQQMRSWPDPIQVFIRGWLQQTSATMQRNLVSYIQGLLSFGFRSILALVSTISFGLSLLFIPTWLFAVLNDQRKGTRILDSVLPDRLRPDFWAAVRIVDRTFSVYLRELVVMGFAVAVATFTGLKLLERLGGQAIPFPLLLAIFAGFTDLIPTVGIILGTIPAVLFGLAISWQTALAILVLYIIVHFLRNWLLAPLFTGRSITIHPGILVVILLIASQFGLLWLFVAAPLAQVLVDLFRYTYGRFSDPARPAGVLPGEPAPSAQLRPVGNRRAMTPSATHQTAQASGTQPPGAGQR